MDRIKKIALQKPSRIKVTCNFCNTELDLSSEDLSKICVCGVRHTYHPGGIGLRRHNKNVPWNRLQGKLKLA